jgi:type II secretion system protein L
MTVLRILLSALPAPGRAEAWALYDAAGHCVRRGRDASTAWPPADRREAVLAADLVRIVALALPPMAPSRLASAATYALEDQLATTAEAPVIAVTPQRADGTTLATVAARATIASIADHRPRFERAIAEPALSTVVAGWSWFASGSGAGFVRRADGSAFAVDAPAFDGELPAVLAAALAQASRAGTAPGTVAVAFPCDDDALVQWTHATGISFARTAEWRWDAAAPAAYTEAADLLQGEFKHAAVPAGPGLARLFRPALAIAALALGVHVTATLAQWLWLKYDGWRTARAIVALAQEAGLPEATSPDAAARAIARRHAELRHRAKEFAPADALPLLARAAPALGTLPAGALKSATYADGAWTIELAAIDPAALAAIDRRLANAGVSALQAKTGAGYRMRVSIAP